uniref:Uncharacterized protein n=1 Tax=Anguilla anguilla TaxID=7936 RepID=A0A0E9SLZ3_ANGAN
MLAKIKIYSIIYLASYSGSNALLMLILTVTDSSLTACSAVVSNGLVSSGTVVMLAVLLAS